VGSDKNDGDPRASLGTPLAHLAIAWHVRRIIGTGEARKIKFGFGKRIHLGKSHHKHDKIPQMGRGQVQGDFLNFGSACIYLDRVKLDISNFTNSCNVASTS